MKKTFTCLWVIIVVSINALSQTTLVTSFKTDSEGALSIPKKSGGKLFFSAADSTHGRELWVTDGTTAGTFLVKDIHPGFNSGVSINFDYSAYDHNGILYFKANNGNNGTQLWRSDGTETGTWMVKNLYIGQTDYGLSDFASLGSVLYFISNTGKALWRSDGTENGTYIVKNFAIVRSLTTFKNRLYFSAAPDNSGEELWRSDGTVNGTYRLKDLNGAYGASLPVNFHATSDALYFMAATNAGWEMWRTTGTEASTVMVKDINPGGGNGVLSYYSEAVITHIGNTIYFRADDGVNGYQLWKSDGTENGTVRVSAIPGQLSPYCTFPVVDGTVLFNTYNGPRYWKYDPVSNTSSETGYPFYAYFDLNKGRNSAFIGSRLFFPGMDLYTAQSCGIQRGRRRIPGNSRKHIWLIIFSLSNRVLSPVFLEASEASCCLRRRAARSIHGFLCMPTTPHFCYGFCSFHTGAGAASQQQNASRMEPY